MSDVPAVMDFFFSAMLNFTNCWFSTFPLSLAASLAVLVLVFKLYNLLL